MRTSAIAVRRFGTAISPALEIVLPVAFIVCILLAARSGYAVGQRPVDLLGSVLILVANLPLVARRRAPVTVLVICCVGLLASTAAGYWEALNSFGTLLALYTVAAVHPRRTSAPAAALTTVVLAATAITAGIGQIWVLVILAATFGLTAWMVGDVRRLLVLQG